MRHISIALSFGSLLSTLAWGQDPGIANLPDSLMEAGTKVVWVKKLPFYCEGPAVDKDGVLFFDQQMDNNNQDWPIWKINPAVPTDTGSVFLRASSQANGINFDKDWRMVVCQNQQITRFESGGATTILAQSGDGANFGQANDMSIGSSGAMYFTDLGSNVYYVDGTGKIKVVYSQASRANGIEWIEEKNQLNLNQTGGPNQTGDVTRFQTAADGSISNPTSLAKVNGPDGGCMDEHGNLYIASYSDGAIRVFNAAGTKLGDITMTATGVYDARPGKQGNTDNCTFGGPDNKTLYFTGDGGAYSLRVKVAGRRIPGTVASVARGIYGTGYFLSGKNADHNRSQRVFFGLLGGDFDAQDLGVNPVGRTIKHRRGLNILVLPLAR